MLIPTMPDLIARATRWPRAGSPVQTVAKRPYWTSFAIRIASFSSSNGIAVTTGPKISSCATVIEVSTPASTVGEIEGARAVAGLAADHDLGSLLAPFST